MLILLYGEDGFRSRQKLNEIIKQYQDKNQIGLSLIRFKENDLDIDKIRQNIESVSMFDEKKLIILEDVFKNKIFFKDFSKYIKKNKLKDNQNIIVVLYQDGKLTGSAFKGQFSMFEEFKSLNNVETVNWLKKEISKNNIDINHGALIKLVSYIGNDLWQLNNEINKLDSYKNGKTINEEDIDILVNVKIDTNIFNTLDALAKRDKKTAFKLLHEHLEQGENEIYLLSMFVYQVRTLIKLKDLIEKGTTYYDLAKKSKLHPFVIKKSSEQLNNFSLEQLKKVYHRLLEIDLELKKGHIDGQVALDLLIAEI